MYTFRPEYSQITHHQTEANKYETNAQRKGNCRFQNMHGGTHPIKAFKIQIEEKPQKHVTPSANE